jgi:hypothetical protein
LITILTSSYGQVTCPSGWRQYGGSCYLFNPALNSGSQYGTWDQCNAYCPSSYPGAMMLCIRNAAEHDWIYSQVIGVYWIGFTDMSPYGGGKGTKQYGWVTGCSSTYTKWYPGEPNNMDNNQDCAVIVNGLWDDLSSLDINSCACQYNPALSTVAPSKAPTTAPSTVDVFE